MKNKKLQNIFAVLLAVVFAAGLFFFHYKDRINAMLANPETFFSAAVYNIKRIAGWSDFSWQTLGINVALALSCLFVECLFTGWNKSSLKRLVSKPDRSAVGDLWLWLLGVFQLYYLLTILFSFGIFYVLISIVVKSYHFHLVNYIPNGFLQFMVVLLASDLKHYIRHALSHKIGWFWELHKYHHSAEHLNMITVQRGHFLETAVITLFDAALFVLAGVPAESYLSILLFREAHQMFIHSEVNWKWGWVGKYILVSPAAHQIHHSNAQDHYDSNYGNMFIFWDRMFDSWYDPNSYRNPITFGLTDSPYNKAGFFSDMFTVYRLFINRIKSYFIRPV